MGEKLQNQGLRKEIARQFREYLVFEEKPYREVAKMSGLPLGTVCRMASSANIPRPETAKKIAEFLLVPKR